MDRRGFVASSILWPIAGAATSLRDVREFGALGDGVADDTAPFQRALDSGGLILVSPGEYLVGTVTSSRPVGLVGSYRLSTIRLLGDRTREPAIVLQHAGCFLHGIHFDGDDRGRSCVALRGARCAADISAERVTADPAAPAETSGIEVTGQDCSFSIEADNFFNTGHANGSTPRMVTVQGRADRYRGKFIRGVGVTSGLVVGAETGRGAVGSIEVFEAEDNGLYQLGGSLAVDLLDYHGLEEAVVTKGDLSVTSVRVRGEGICAVGLENAGRVWLGRLDVRREGARSVRSLWRTRRENRVSSEFIVDSVIADLAPLSLGSFETGTLERAVIRNLHARCSFDGSGGRPSRFLDFRGVRSFDLSKWNITIVEDDPQGDRRATYQALFESEREEASGRWDDVRVAIETRSGDRSPADFRAVGLAAPGRVVRGGEWQGNVGPYVREFGFNGGIPDSINHLPTSGTWRKGTRLTLIPQQGPVASAICLESGTPGRWQAS